MNKMALYAIGSGMVAIPAVSFYVSPAAPAQSEVAPILVQAPAGDVIEQLKRMRVKGFFWQFKDMATSRNSEDFDRAFRESTRRVSDNEVVLSLYMLGDHLFDISATVTPKGPGETSVDIKAVIPDNRLTKSSKLHPYDRQALAAMTELIATEYASSVLKKQRMVIGDELVPAFLSHVGFTREQASVFFARLREAGKEAYETDLRHLASEPHWDSRSDWENNPQDAAAQATEAAAQASEAAEYAAQDARDAACQAIKSAGADPADYADHDCPN